MATISDFSAQAQLSEAAYTEKLVKGMAGGGTESNPSEYAHHGVGPR